MPDAASFPRCRPAFPSITKPSQDRSPRYVRKPEESELPDEDATSSRYRHWMATRMSRIEMTFALVRLPTYLFLAFLLPLLTATC